MPVVVDTNAAGGQPLAGYGTVVRLADGRVAIFWNENSTGTFTVYMQMYNRNLAPIGSKVNLFGSSGILGTGTAASQSAFHRDGKIYLVSRNGLNVDTAKLNNLGAPGAAASWSALGENGATDAAVYGINASGIVGEIVVNRKGTAYLANGSGANVVIKEHRGVGMSWSSQVQTNKNAFAGNAMQVAIAIDDDGYIHLAYLARSTSKIWYQRSLYKNDINSWMPEVTVLTGASDMEPCGIVTSGKRIFVAGEESAVGSDTLRYNYSADGGQTWYGGTTGTVISTTARTEDGPSLTNLVGDAVIAIFQNNGTGAIFYTSRLTGPTREILLGRFAGAATATSYSSAIEQLPSSGFFEPCFVYVDNQATPTLNANILAIRPIRPKINPRRINLPINWSRNAPGIPA